MKFTLHLHNNSEVHCVGGWLWQQADSMGPDEITFTTVSDTQPTEQQLADLAFAWRCVKHVKSNAITVAKEQRLLGMGSGQPNRVKSVQIALEKAAEDVEVGSEFTYKSLAVACSGFGNRALSPANCLHQMLHQMLHSHKLYHSGSHCNLAMAKSDYPD